MSENKEVLIYIGPLSEPAPPHGWQRYIALFEPGEFIICGERIKLPASTVIYTPLPKPDIVIEGGPSTGVPEAMATLASMQDRSPRLRVFYYEVKPTSEHEGDRPKCPTCDGTGSVAVYVEGMNPFLGGPPTMGGWESRPCPTCSTKDG